MKVWKAVKFEATRGVIIVQLLIPPTVDVKVLRGKTLIAMSHGHARIIPRHRNSFSIPLLLLMPWHFELDVWYWLLAGFKVRSRKYLSATFIFWICHPDGFSLLVKNQVDSGPKILNSGWGDFRKERIVGVSWRWFSRPRRPKKRPR